MTNKNLASAKKSKNDEFYTQYEDIEKEVNEYYEYNKNVFKNKTLLLPCDDPEWSNFTKYFVANFDRFGLKKLISTSYIHSAGSKQLSLSEKNSDEYDPEKHNTKGKIFVLDRGNDHSGRIDIADLKFHYLEGDGDYRSKEVTKLRDEADIIITNPPFSMFRDFLNWILEANKKFLIIGNNNAVTYKEIFPLLKKNIIWLGVPFKSGNAYFNLPKSADVSEYAKGVYNPTNHTVKFRNVSWFTNLDHGRRHQPLSLMSMSDNIKFSKHKEIRGKSYYHYINYDAIEVPFTDSIPDDYDGIMGVPITFLDKYNPSQFKIIGLAAGNSRKTGLYGDIKYKPSKVDRGGCGVVNGKRKYARILIKRIK